MTTIEEPAIVADLDSVAESVAAYIKLSDQIADWEVMRSALRKAIEAAMGDAEIGTVAGVKRVRWAKYMENRLSVTEVRKRFSATELEECFIQHERRKFYLVREGDTS